jgi:branched-chain amino acid transport system permease protein
MLERLFDAIVTKGAGPAASISNTLPEMLRAPACFLILLVGGGLCAAAAGLIVGLPTLRLRGDYLAIATLGFAEIIRVAIQNAEPLGGPLGLGGIPNYTSFGWLYGAALVTIIVIWRIAYSDKGRAIQAVREDEIAAASIGVDPTHHKVLSFVIGSFFAGVGGVLYAHFTGFITPQPTEFGLIRSIEFVVMVTLGGLGSISGAILAAVVLTMLPEVLRNVSSDVVEWRMVIYALLLIAMMLLRPQGLLGGRELWPRGWRGRGRRGDASRHAPPTPPVNDAPEPETKAL